MNEEIAKAIREIYNFTTKDKLNLVIWIINNITEDVETEQHKYLETKSTLRAIKKLNKNKAISNLLEEV